MTGTDPAPDRPGAPGDDAGAEAGKRPMHPSLEPTGEHVAHSAIGSLLGGVLVWGGVGLLLDHWLGTGRVLTAVGVVVGSLTGFAIVYLRFGRNE
jgi:F0F1-type ATP synthase assembly protein I